MKDMTTFTASDELKTYTEVAKHLKVSKKTIGRLVKAGDLKVVYAGARPRIKWSEVIRYLESRS